MRIFLPLIILISIQSKAFGQIDFTELVISDSIYLDYIRTIEFRNTQNELSLPVLDIKSGTLICEFDDSYGDFIDYHYTIVHCDKEWNITEDVEVSEYLEGQDNISIEDYQSSVNTIMKYNHYSFSFPNDDLSFIWSGNYLLVVYDDEGTIAFTKKFYVIDNQTVINPSSVSPMVDGVYDTHQAFMVDLDVERLDPMNPIDEVYVTVFQNRFNERLMPFRQAVRMDNNTAIFNSIACNRTH